MVNSVENATRKSGQTPQTITSRANPLVKNACRLAASAAFRAQQGMFIAEGVRLCTDLAQSLCAKTVFVTQKALDKNPSLAALAQETYIVAEQVAQKLADTKTPQGVFAVFPYPKTDLQSVVAEKPCLVCEDVADPANLGAIVRSAAGLGFGGVLLTKNCADPFSPKALRAGMGSVVRIPLVQGLSVNEIAGGLHQKGFTLYAAALEGAVPFKEIKADNPAAILIGNEGAGLSPAALAAADKRVFIPMHNGVESLNAAVAAAVLMSFFAE